MKKLLSTIFALCLATSVLFAAAVSEFDFHASNIELLQFLPVQKELGVTQAQKNKMNGYATTYKTKVQAFAADFKKSGKDPSKVTTKDTPIPGYMNELKTNVLSVLSPGQTKRLRELTLQRAGVRGLLDPKVAKQVGIGETQLKKMQGFFIDAAKRIRTMDQKALKEALQEFEGKKPATQAEADALKKKAQENMKVTAKKYAPQARAIEKEADDKILATLSANQKTSWSTLKGKTFVITKS